ALVEEDLGDRHVRLFFDHGVEIDEAPLELRGEQEAHRRLAAARQANEEDGPQDLNTLRGRHDKPPSYARAHPSCRRRACRRAHRRARTRPLLPPPPPPPAPRTSRCAPSARRKAASSPDPPKAAAAPAWGSASSPRAPPAASRW